MAKETGYELEKKRRKANLKERDDGKVPQEDLGQQRTPSTETAAVQRRPRQGSPGQTPQGGGGSPSAVLDELRAKAQGASPGAGPQRPATPRSVSPLTSRPGPSRPGARQAGPVRPPMPGVRRRPVVPGAQGGRGGDLQGLLQQLARGVTTEGNPLQGGSGPILDDLRRRRGQAVPGPSVRRQPQPGPAASVQPGAPRRPVIPALPPRRV
ncbi:MAG: hypothetical protein MK239_07555 [Gemmatimonadetes bacterium]|nr:hypothetical protein [Gemmatimonadota bacterium]